MTGSASLLDGIDLVVFDKDGTLIDFQAMWGSWAIELAGRLGAATGRAVQADLHRAMGTDPVTGRALPGAAISGPIMARLRAMAVEVAIEHGLTPAEAEDAVAKAWQPPDPVATAKPLADLHALFDRLRAESRRIAVVTADDRAATEATLAALGLTDLVDATACADDGLASKPAPDMLLRVCRQLGVEPGRTAIVGDSSADLQMGRAAAAGLVIGVLTGVGDRELLEPLADLLIADVGALMAWLPVAPTQAAPARRSDPAGRLRPDAR